MDENSTLPVIEASSSTFDLNANKSTRRTLSAHTFGMEEITAPRTSTIIYYYFFFFSYKFMRLKICVFFSSAFFTCCRGFSCSER
jgi:hypothetical protein